MNQEDPIDLSGLKLEYPSPPRLHWLWLLLASSVGYFWSAYFTFHNGHSVSGWRSQVPEMCESVVIDGWLLIQVLWFRSVNSKSALFPLYLLAVLIEALSFGLQIAYP